MYNTGSFWEVKDLLGKRNWNYFYCHVQFIFLFENSNKMWFYMGAPCIVCSKIIARFVAPYYSDNRVSQKWRPLFYTLKKKCIAGTTAVVFLLSITFQEDCFVIMQQLCHEGYIPSTFCRGRSYSYVSLIINFSVCINLCSEKKSYLI